jgi:hypothetical protein
MKPKTTLMIIGFFISAILMLWLGWFVYQQIRWNNHKMEFAGDPVLILSLDKSVYAIGEPVEARIGLLNEGKGDLLIAAEWDIPAFHYAPLHYNLVLFDEMGNEISPLIPNNNQEYNPPSFFLIAPYENVPCNNCKKTITGLYGLYSEPLKNPGTYTIQAEYWNHLDSQDGRKAWKGELKSNMVRFEIK